MKEFIQKNSDELWTFTILGTDCIVGVMAAASIWSTFVPLVITGFVITVVLLIIQLREYENGFDYAMKLERERK
jgi:hypothetical protein